MKLNSTKRSLFTAITLFGLSGCAHLHTVKIGERRLAPANATPFDAKVSETGFNVKEATQAVKIIGNGNASVNRTSDTVNNLYSLVSFGPKTGNDVLNTEYADSIGSLSNSQCSPANTVGVVSVRETMKYPVISGEIVKIEGLCK